MANLLYYPYINLPRTEWTLRTLMYYDNVGSIVPRSFFYHPEENYDPFMLELVRLNLVTPIDPMQVLDHPIGAVRPFLEIVRTNQDKLKKTQKAFRKHNESHGEVPNVEVPMIHDNKFDTTVFEHLMDLGLAKRGEGGWYIVERKTANSMMQFLATVISAKTNRLPVTDYIRPFTYSKTEQKQQVKRETILKNLIPYPSEIDLAGLMRFKDKYSGLAESFRNRVEQVVHNPTILEGTPLFHYKMAEMIEQKEELVARMKETNNIPKIFFGSVCGIISAGTNVLEPNPFSVVGAIAGFGSAIQSALQIERAHNVIDQSGMKYLALADYKLKK